MPELNTNLLASIGQNTADVGKAYGEAMSLKNLAGEQQLKDLQIKQIKSDLKKQQDIESLSKGVDWSDPKAAQAGISKITQRDPATGMALNKQYTDLATAKNQMSEQELNLLNTKNDVIAGSLVGVKTEYDKLIAEGKDPKLAAAMVTPLYIQAAQGLAKQKEADGTPMLDKEHLQAIHQNPAYNDEVVTGWIEQSQKSRDFLKGQLELHQKAKEDTETVRHDKAMEAIQTEKANAAKVKSSGGEMTPDAIHNAAAQYNLTGKLPPMGQGGAVLKAKILNDAAAQLKAAGKTQQAATVEQAGFKANQTAYAALQKSRAFIESFTNTALKNADLVLQESSKVDRTGVPAFNRWLLAGKKSLAGDAEVARLDTVINTTAEEYAKVLSGATGNQAATDSARNMAHDMINSAQTPEQLRGVIEMMKAEATNRINAMSEQAQEIQASMGLKTQEATPDIPTATDAKGNKVVYKDGKWQPP